MPFLKRRFKTSGVIRTRTLKVVGLPESKVDIKVRSLLKNPPPLTVGIYSKPSLVELKITAQARNERLAGRMIDKADRKISSLLGGHIFGRDEETLEEVVGRKLTAARKTVAVAESCTGGLISGRFTDIPGSSVYFKGAIIAYSNEIKTSVLGVKSSTIKKFGAVSRQTAGEMAAGVMRLTGASFGLSVTGIAGPSGSTKDKPIGLVYISLAGPRGSACREFRFRGDRNAIRSKASQAALDLIRVSL
jgi:nicotinamide-nucleotide amidase